jgi:cytoskeletal protein CcmA (bactofilin family)
MKDGAVFSGRLQIPNSKLRVEAGVSADFDTVTCEELTVEGHVKLATTLTTEKLAVLSGGELIAPTVRAGRIEVSPGGTLQALIEKYTPPEKPKEPEPKPQVGPEEMPETESKAEAA